MKVDLRSLNTFGVNFGVEAGLASLNRRYSAVTLLGKPRVSRHERVVFDVLVGHDKQHLVVKVDSDQQRWQTEITGTRFAAQYIPTVSLVLLEPGPPSIIAYEYISGIPLTGCDNASWQAAGDTLARLHAAQYPYPVPPLSTWHKHLLQRANEGCELLIQHGITNDAFARQLLNEMEQGFSNLVPDRLSPLHGDCYAEHFLIGANSSVADTQVVGVLDFADFGCGDPIMDIVALTERNPEKLESLLAGYQPRPEVLSRLASTEQAYRLLRQVGITRWRAEHSLATSKDLTNLQSLLPS